MSLFSQKVLLITGAGSGIGQATAVRLSQLGASGLALSDVNTKNLEVTKDLCLAAGSAKVVTTTVDVSQTVQVEAWVADTLREFGRLDGAANVAGIAGGDGDTVVETIKQEDWDRMLGINLGGVMNCMRAQLPHLPTPGGAIVNVASTAGIRGLPKSAAYCASKWGVVGLTKSGAAEYGRKGIRINAVLPGPIDTAIFRDGEAKGLFSADTMGGNTALGRMGKAEEVAKVLCFLLSDDASFVTGADWAVDGGYTAC